MSPKLVTDWFGAWRVVVLGSSSNLDDVSSPLPPQAAFIVTSITGIQH